MPPYLGLPCVLYLGRAVLTVFRETLVSFCCQARVTRLYLNVTLSINAMITSSYSSCKPKSDTGDENDEKANVCYISYQSCGEKHSWTRNSSRFAQINIRQLCVQCKLYNSPVIEKLQPWGGSWCDGVYRKNWWFIGKVQVVHLVANICVDQVTFASHRLCLYSGHFQLLCLA